MGRERMDNSIPSRLCGRAFHAADLAQIHQAITEAQPPLRAEIARRVCQRLDWTDVQGRPKLMSARVGLLRLHRAGLIELPAPSRGNGNGRGLVHGPQGWPEPIPVTAQLRELSGLRLEPVADQCASRLWNGLIDRYHYLGYTPLPGAQLRYLIQWRWRGAGCHRLWCCGLEGRRARYLDRLDAPGARSASGPGPE